MSENRFRMSLAMPSLACILLAAFPPTANAAPQAESDEVCAAGSDCASTPVDESWVDDSYEYVTSRTDSLAVWLDSFFATPEADLESADSVLRLRTEYQWDEEDGNDVKVRLRGKVDLPRINRRLSLVFAEEDEDRDQVIPNDDSSDNDVGLQYRLSERTHSRLYFSVGTNSSLDFKSSLRYRFVYPISQDWRWQFSERLYYKQNDGFGALTRTDLDYSLSDNRIIRWTNQVDYGEETDGLEWGSKLNYQIRLNEKEALSYFTGVSGETDPSLTKAYAVGVRYRRNLFRPWIFFEIEPSHEWRRESTEEQRQSVWILTFRLEFLEELKNRRGSREGTVQGGNP
ncbi:MAG: hypothetical protein IPF49_05835 [Gammaproteobacteria bacterium]|nr:hypothetical protein [Gammaproteobacteria bacterium]